MIVLAGLLGWLAGCFVNLAADRLPPHPETGERRGMGRPVCLHCGQPWPAPGWSALGRLLSGRHCRQCGRAAGWRGPVVEVALPLVLAWVWSWAGGDVLRFLAAATVSVIFALICVIDIEHRLILWRTVWVSALILLALAFLPEPFMPQWWRAPLGGVLGFGLVFLMFLLGQGYMWLSARLRGQPVKEIAFGGGDVNLAALIGLAVGSQDILPALFIGVLIGGLFSLGYIVQMLLRRRYNPHQPLPYGPFLVAGAVIMYFFRDAVYAWWGISL